MGSTSGVELVNILNLLLPGTANVYMGDEIGMDSYWDIDRDLCPPEVRYDYRTPSRTPFQWSREENAGFTTNDTPWLPVNPNHDYINVAYQECNYCSVKGISYLENFKLLTQLKAKPAFSQGSITTHVLNNHVFSFTRRYQSQVYVVLMNLNEYLSKTFDIEEVGPGISRDNFVKVEMRSVNLFFECFDGSECGEQIFAGDWKMPPKSALVLSFYRY